MLSGVIYVHRISDRRFTGIAGRNFNMFRELCGDAALGNAVLFTNMWKGDSYYVNEAREKDLSSKFFKPALDKGALMVRHHNTAESAQNIVRMLIVKPPVVLRIQRELVDERKDFINTTAGKAIRRELDEQIRQHQAEFNRVWDDMAQALKEQDDATRKELAEELGRLQERMEKIKKDSDGMAANYAVEKQRMEARMTVVEQISVANRPRLEQAKEERQLVKAADLGRRLHREAAADRARLEQEMEKLQERATTMPPPMLSRQILYVQILFCLATYDS